MAITCPYFEEILKQLWLPVYRELEAAKKHAAALAEKETWDEYRQEHDESPGA